LAFSGFSFGQDRPEIQLANVYQAGIHVEDYWVSEKLDGVRAYWDGIKLISKSGRVYSAPGWFTANFPDFPLDGELWLSRNNFERLSGIVRQKIPKDILWEKVTYQVFDLPASREVFDQRLQSLRDFFSTTTLPQWLQLVEQFRVKNHQHLMNLLDEKTKLGAEGLMLHLGVSYYHNKRNDDLLKLKAYMDAEARVISHHAGKGKYQGMLGSMQVEAVNKTQKGKRFNIGTGFSDLQRQSPPPVDSIITYKYFGFTNTGKPRFASFMRVRGGFESDEVTGIDAREYVAAELK